MIQTLDANLTCISFKVIDWYQIVIGGKMMVVTFVPGDVFANTNIPNDANSRDFTGHKNKSVKERIQTLQSEPEMFVHKSLGIRAVASDVFMKGNEIIIYFGKGEGIFNGGHTYEVLKKYGNSKASVEMRIDVDLPTEKLVEISTALNSSKHLQDDSRGNKMGAFQWIKDVLPNEKIIYKEGQLGRYRIGEVLVVANLFKIGKGGRYAENSLTYSLRQKGAVIRETIENNRLENTKYILPDIWSLYKEIRSDAIIQNCFPKKFIKKGELVPGLVLVLMSGLRYTTEINKNNMPVWKDGFSSLKAMKLCEKLSKEIGKVVNKTPYKDITAESVIRDNNFHNKVQRIFADELM